MEDEYSNCTECIDHKNTFINDLQQCECSDGELMFGTGGYCQKCNVPGCKICMNMNPDVCMECLSPSAQLIDDICQCDNEMEIDTDGECTRNSACPIGCICD